MGGSIKLPDEHLRAAGRATDFIGALLQLNQDAQLLLDGESGRFTSGGLLPAEDVFGNGLRGSAHGSD
jgi:hypothetical protein